LKFLALSALATTLCLTSIAASAQGDDSNGKRLEGSWKVQIVVTDCNLGTALTPPFLSLLTFGRGGTLVETTSNPSFYPAVRGPGHGVWAVAPGGAFQATSTAFITLNGVLQRIQTIDQTIELISHDVLHTTSATVTFYNPAGGVLAQGCASATGTRITLQ
jgi:hypothetical protein